MNEIIPHEQSYLAPAAKLEFVLQAYQAKKDFIERVLDEGKDYGVTPGTNSKPALLKPGAEKLINFFGMFPTLEDVTVIEDWMGDQHSGEPFFYYRRRCNLWRIINGERVLVGCAEGSCNSWEKKYRYRQQDRICPACGNETIIKGKEEFGGGWICFRKKGGCGAKFQDGDESIESQQVGQIKNPDVADLANTILKMADKRALVASALITTGASDYFTQDVDDFVDGTFTETESPVEAKHPARQSAPPKKANGNGWNPVQILVDCGACPDNFSASELVNKYVPKEIITGKDKAALETWGKLYRSWRDAGADTTPSAENATAGIAPK